jgi:hypothetical protein
MVMKALLPKSDSVDDALILSRQETLLLKSHCTSKNKPPGVMFADATTSLGSQWLFATPNLSLGQVMELNEYRAALAFRLLMPILPLPLDLRENNVWSLGLWIAMDITLSHANVQAI